MFFFLKKFNHPPDFFREDVKHLMFFLVGWDEKNQLECDLDIPCLKCLVILFDCLIQNRVKSKSYT